MLDSCHLDRGTAEWRDLASNVKIIYGFNLFANSTSKAIIKRSGYDDYVAASEIVNVHFSLARPCLMVRQEFLIK
jgi:hypothetical protein